MIGKGGCVYILTNYSNITLYVGVTSDLFTRIHDHKSGKYPGSFSSRYKLYKLVYYESFHSIEEAILREKQLKGGSRKKKMDLITKMNPDWRESL